jgi:proteasome lid subunit RPN8/RPN11
MTSLSRNEFMAINLKPEELEDIRAHGARDYPSECCGVLLGYARGERKEVSKAVPLRNLRHDPTRAQELLPVEDPGRESDKNRFLIDPADQLRVEKDSRERGLEVLGYYHSHPDHPARPSNYDREHAWPWYSYVILSVEQGEPKDVTSWVLSKDRLRFEQEDLKLM